MTPLTAWAIIDAYLRAPTTPLRSLKTALTFTGAASFMGIAMAAFWSVMRKLNL